MTMPLLVISSRGVGWTTSLSPSGFRDVAVPVSEVAISAWCLLAYEPG
jgi:hypothetical protein